MEYFIYFVITISVLVFVHEFGHFAAAKLCRMRTDVFAIGFGKRLFGWNRVNGFTWGDLPKDFDQEGHTDYRLSLLPLGGYVKIVGMVDESFDTDFADKEPQPYEFRSKPTYQKLFVITAGVLMNFLLTVAIFWGMNFVNGKFVLDTTKVGYVSENSFAGEAGFKEGDEILSINDKPVKNWEDVYNNILLVSADKSAEIKVLRDNKETELKLDKEMLAKVEPSSRVINTGDVVAIVGQVVENSPAQDAGLKDDDEVLELKGIPVTSGNQLYDIMAKNKDEQVTFKIVRDGDTSTITSKLDMQGKLGVYFSSKYVGKTSTISYGFFGSLSQSFSDIGNVISLTYAMLRKVVSGDVEFGKVFGGPLKIAEMAGDTANMGIGYFLKFIASLSLSLALINIMPFPVLDGGHFVMILIEGIIRRELPIKIKIAIQNVGFIILMILMAFIIYSDAINIF